MEVAGPLGTPLGLAQRRGTDTVTESGRIINVEIESYGITSVVALMNTLMMRAQEVPSTMVTIF